MVRIIQLVVTSQFQLCETQQSSLANLDILNSETTANFKEQVTIEGLRKLFIREIHFRPSVSDSSQTGREQSQKQKII